MRAVGSINYYHTEDGQPNRLDDDVTVTSGELLVPEELVSAETVKRITLTQSKQIPSNLRRILFRILDIRLHGTLSSTAGTKVLAFAVYGSTVLTGFAFLFFHIYFELHNIISLETKQDALYGSISILLAAFWTLMGMYAHQLLRRVFSNPAAYDVVRLHSRTVLKMHAAFLSAGMGLIFILANVYDAFLTYNNHKCSKVGLKVWICETYMVFRLFYSVLAWWWNALVAMVLFSISRTHTIGIRRFVRDLELDAAEHDSRYMRLRLGPQCDKDDRDSSLIGNDFEWVDDRGEILDPETNSAELEDEDEGVSSRLIITRAGLRSSLPSSSGFFFPAPQSLGSSSISLRKSSAAADWDEDCFAGTSTDQRPVRIRSETITLTTAESNLVGPDETDETKLGSKSMPGTSETLKEATNDPTSLTQRDILHNYWRISRRVRMSSLCLQRWLVCVVCLCLLWVCVHLVTWLRHPPSGTQIVQFLLLLLYVPLLSLGYCEVNNEGSRLIRAICPTPENLRLINYLNQMPLQMNVYGFPIRYSTLVTAVFGLTVALASGIILQEIKNM